MLLYRLLADVVVLVHALYVAAVVLGLVLFWIGLAAGWRWARSFWLRTIHLAMIGVVALQAVAGVVCPLTLLENHFRRLAGQATYAGAFIARWVHELLFIQAPSWAFTVGYVAFGLLVLATYVLAPPRWPRRGAARPRQ